MIIFNCTRAYVQSYTLVDIIGLASLKKQCLKNKMKKKNSNNTLFYLLKSNEFNLCIYRDGTTGGSPPPHLSSAQI